MNIEEAQRQINEILQTLEKSTGSVVKQLSLDKIETTCVTDWAARYQVTSVIEMERLPSQDWNI